MLINYFLYFFNLYASLPSQNSQQLAAGEQGNLQNKGSN